MAKTILGLDLGPNSIGWALIKDDPNDPANCGLVDLGVRAFHEGVDKFDTSKETSRNEARRVARGMRRQTRRRTARRRQLLDALIAKDMFPASEEQQAQVYNLDPYQLRSRALHEKLSLHELGRILLHLSKRRGFKSNRKERAKADAKAQRKKDRNKEKRAGEKSTEDILLEMAELEQDIRGGKFKTLGEYLYNKLQRQDCTNRIENDHVRGRHILRSLLIEEFEAIWTKQAGYYPKILTPHLAYGKLGKQKDIRRPIAQDSVVRSGLDVLESFGLFGIMFFHRTLKPVPKEIVGLCELEPKQRRCPRAHRHAQQFRLLQELNNLRYIDPDSREECSLTEGQRQLLFEHLSTRETTTFEDIRKRLGFLDSVLFKQEKGKRTSIKGMETDWLLAKHLGRRWHTLSHDIKDLIVEALLRSVDEDETYDCLVNQLGLTSEEAERVLIADLPEGYLNLSLAAIDKLLPFMRNGCVYEHADPSKSARAQAGYDEPWALERRIFDKLPDPHRSRDCPIGDIPNPVVKRTLTELRKVVNAILRVYGRPDEVHVEMGRDVKTRPKDPKSPAYRKYKQEEAARAEREAVRTRAKEFLRERGQPFGAGGVNILKVILWWEQNETCIYSGKPISPDRLLSSEIDIDHILPVPGLDDSQMNKVVCFRIENHGKTGKGHRTPRQWLEHSNQDKWEEVCQRARKLPYPKYQRILRKDFAISEFIDRQLNDNRYIAKATAQYLKLLFGADENRRGAVLGVKGMHTAVLRRQWGLETILSELPDSPAWIQNVNLRPGLKNRSDHRHHAIDAVVLALTSKSRLQLLSSGFTVIETENCNTGELELRTAYRGPHLELPWKTLRDDVAAHLAKVNVSHRVERKAGKGFHDDKPFGPIVDEQGAQTPGLWVKRKNIEELSASEVLAIRDTSRKSSKLGIRQLVVKALIDAGIEVRSVKKSRGKPSTLFVDTRTGAKASDKSVKEVLAEVRMPSGVPVRKVRLTIRNDTVRAIRLEKARRSSDQTQIAFVNPNSTHHLSIFEYRENEQRKREAVFVTMLDAAEILSKRQQEMAALLEEWKSLGLGEKEIKKRKQRATSEIEQKYPLIDRRPPSDHQTIPPDAEFIMSLSAREMVLAEWKGQQKLLIFKTAASTQGQIYFAEHTDARRSSEQAKFVATANSLIARKVTVDPLGRIRWAND